jgi:hypothetical protein
VSSTVGLADGRAEKYLRTLSIAQPGEIMLVLALIGAQGVGGFQLDVSLAMAVLIVAPIPLAHSPQTTRIPCAPRPVPQ